MLTNYNSFPGGPSDNFLILRVLQYKILEWFKSYMLAKSMHQKFILNYIQYMLSKVKYFS